MTNISLLLPLQVPSITNFEIDSTVSPLSLIIFGSVFAVLILVIVVINKKSSPMTKAGGGGGGGGFTGFFSAFTFHRLAKNMGLNSDQTKMLDYVLKTDGVTEPEKSLGSPNLLDRHFRRAYRVIEQSSGTEEEAQRRLAVLFSTRNILENSTIGAIANTRQLRDDTVLNITYNKEKYEVSVLSTRNENLIVEAPTTILGSQVKIPNGTHLTIIFFSRNNKGHSFETRVVGYGNFHGHYAMQLTHSSQLRLLSQRRFRRRSAVIACFLNLVYVEGSGKKQRLIVDKRRISGTIADISVGGCSVKAIAPVQVGAKFKIEFMQRNVNVAALGQVLRTNRAGMSTTLHVRFLKVTQKSMNIINSYVYEYANE